MGPPAAAYLVLKKIPIDSSPFLMTLLEKVLRIDYCSDYHEPENGDQIDPIFGGTTDNHFSQINTTTQFGLFCYDDWYLDKAKAEHCSPI